MWWPGSWVAYMSELPLLDETRCTGCGDCVAVCPTNCLAMAAPLPWLPRPMDCVSCALCCVVCPEDALTMKQRLGSA
jgi:MinD superfamily P-loop ATPase